MFQQLSCILLLSVSGILASASWDYSGDNSPGNWYKNYPLCGGSSQSPIDLKPSTATLKQELGKFTFRKYDESKGGHELSNNGHTVQLTVGSGDMTVTGGGLPGLFKLVQFHMHWGSTDCEGSEHTIDGKAYPLEIHFVHHNTKYPDIGESLNHADDGLAVLGVFAEVGDNAHPAFDNVVKALKYVKYSDSNKQVKVDSFKMADMLPSNKDKFIRYKGSLTTPTCNEVVTWTLFDQPIKISQAQLDAFRSVSKDSAMSSKNAPLVNNYRPVLKLNGRPVYKSYSDKHSSVPTCSAHSHTAGYSLGLIVVFLTCICSY